MPRIADQPPWQAKLTEFAFVLAGALVIARATILETLRDFIPITPGALAIPRGPGPTVGLVLDLLLCLPALLVLARRVLDEDYRLRLNVSHALFAGIALWAAISTLWASDKFAAAVMSAHFIGAAALMWAMTQLVRSGLRLRLVVGTCLAILLVYVAHGMLYHFVDVPDNIRYWQEHGEEELLRRGWEPGSFQATQFANKLTGGEMIGFSASPNTFAALLVLLGIVCAGAAVQRIRGRDEPGWPAAIIVGIVPAAWILYFTDSRTAFLTPFLAAAILAALALIGPWLARWRRRLYFAGATGLVLLSALLVTHGLHYGTLFHDSLTFRWRYWVGAARIFQTHPILGVGWANFGSYYLGVRLPIASEEVKDPHNLIVRAFVELGIIGGALMIAWLARVMWELTSPLMPTEAAGRSRDSRDRRFTATTLLALSGGGILINVLASVDFSVATPDRGWFVLLELFKRLLFFGLLLIGYALVTLRSSQEAHLDDRPAPWIVWSLITGLAIFLVHNLIDFSLFEPGPMCLFAMLLGAALGARGAARGHAVGPRWLPGAALAAGVALWVAAAVGVVVPVGLAEAKAGHGDEELAAGNASTAGAALKDAFETLWIPNADYAYRAATAFQQAGAAPRQVRPLLNSAISADPMSAAYRRARANFELHLAQPDPRQIIEDYERTISLDPNDVSAHRDFADALLKLGQRQRAIEQYRAALRYNDLLATEEPKRLSSSQIAAIEQQIQSLEK